MKKQSTRMVLLSALLAACSGAWAAGSDASSTLQDIGSKASSTAKDVGSSVTDSALTTEVKAKLLADSDLKSTDIKVTTVHHTVRLSGSVPTQKDATLAEKDALRAAGVHEVENELRIRKSGSESAGDYLSDAAITSKIKTELLTTKDMPASKIHVKTTEGKVLLSGHVDNKEQSVRAVQVARSVSDVKAVKNRLRVQQQ